MPIAMLFAVLTGLIVVVFWIGLADRQQAERQEAALEAALERAFLLERGLTPPPELEGTQAITSEMVMAAGSTRSSESRSGAETSGSVGVGK